MGNKRRTKVTDPNTPNPAPPDQAAQVEIARDPEAEAADGTAATSTVAPVAGEGGTDGEGGGSGDADGDPDATGGEGSGGSVEGPASGFLANFGNGILRELKAGAKPETIIKARLRVFREALYEARKRHEEMIRGLQEDFARLKEDLSKDDQADDEDREGLFTASHDLNVIDPSKPETA